MSLKIYGLKNCDTCRKALKALEAAKLEHEFVDVRADGVAIDQITDWAKTLGWELLLNTRSTTWRGLSDDHKLEIHETKAIALMAEHPTLIKRPVIDTGGQVTVGWTKDVQSAHGL